MEFMVYAGNMYCGELRINKYTHTFKLASCGQITSPGSVQKVKFYKQLKLVRIQ